MSIFARGDRSGQNSCFFENGAVLAEELVDQDEDGYPELIGVPKPLDDDLNNGYCDGRPHVVCQTPADCPGGCSEEQMKKCAEKDACCGTCQEEETKKACCGTCGGDS